MTPNSAITALEADPRRDGAVRLIIDGRPALTVAAEVAAAERLEPGVLPSPDQLVRLEQAADEQAAFRTAVRLIERRPYARADLGRRLKLKGHPATAVHVALDRAAHLGYLNDQRFAVHFVESRSARGRGPARLRRELIQAGVAPDLIDRALGGLAEQVDPDAQVERLIARRLPALRSVESRAARQRLLVYLARRGFQGESVRRRVIAALRESSVEPA